MEVFKQLETLFAAQTAVIRTIVSLFRLEARLAGMSVFPLVITICMLFVILLTLWFSAMILLGYFAALTFKSLYLALFLISGLNLILLPGLAWYLSYNLNNMSFPKTRGYFSPQGADHEQLKKTASCTNCADG